jgi:hypothetical protein
MRRRTVIGVALALTSVALVQPPSIGGAQPSAPAVVVRRFAQNPLITVRSSASLGGNVNGPTVIKVPSWVERPLGRYYMYFANHMGTFIRLAYADAVTGPWTIHEPGVLHVRDTAMFRAQPDPPETLADFYTHVASPEIVVDDARREIHMLFHGWWTNGERWPAEPAEARRWANANRYGQMSQAAVSSDGLRFAVRAPIIRSTYLRVVKRGDEYLAMSRLGALSRSTAPGGPFETGPNPFDGGPYARRVRHVGLVQRGDTLFVFFTAIGDAPERVMLSTIDMRGDWTAWRASEPRLVVQPEAPYECADLPLAPSESGDIDVPARQMRDPFVFEDEGRAYLFYSTCGEQGIAGAELTF